MLTEENPTGIVSLLDEIRSIAQNGLHYTRDPYDRGRYQRLLEMAAEKYADLANLPEDVIMDRFQSELGQVTPKVGVDAAIFSNTGDMFLVKRADDHLWSLPCGWAEIGETPQQAIEREVLEETGLVVEATELIDVFSRLPGEYGQPHTSVHVLYMCEPLSSEVKLSSEVVNSGYYDFHRVRDWHRDHAAKAHRAWSLWEKRNR